MICWYEKLLWTYDLENKSRSNLWHARKVLSLGTLNMNIKFPPQMVTDLCTLFLSENSTDGPTPDVRLCDELCWHNLKIVVCGSENDKFGSVHHYFFSPMSTDQNIQLLAIKITQHRLTGTNIGFIKNFWECDQELNLSRHSTFSAGHALWSIRFVLVCPYKFGNWWFCWQPSSCRIGHTGRGAVAMAAPIIWNIQGINNCLRNTYTFILKNLMYLKYLKYL